MMMPLKGGRLWLLCLLWVSWVSCAEPLLWQVDAPDSGGRAYLFGSIHFGDESLYPLPEYVEQAFNNSDSLVVELDISAVDQAEAGYQLALRGRLPSGVTLRDRLSEAQWQSLKDISSGLGFSVEAFQRLQPWLVAVQITAAQIRRSGLDESFGIDRYMLKTFKESRPGQPIIELESFAEQMSLFDELSDNEEASFLQQTLTEFHKAPDSLRAIMAAWKAGDEASLTALINGAFENREDKLFQRMFSDRNAMMQEKVSARLGRGERLFVVVGAGHVVGSEGLRGLLEQEGYQVKALHP
ncbi:TraB/GumN family protein [Aestuariicella sp. G3-2]|uniref:TraB/GumN family protein n=1 Tax=Pseudomaricurvus albidus TaxID=2842452 RepID=UPI001C0D794A|nr:TraB/GumN family protein [Aestuariicella albida]MBU3070077.1 TraB/GumN family protein [Aestuariicella albida]